MIGLHWLLRMRQWAQNPPSMRQVLFVVTIIAVCLLLAGIELIWGWPEWLTPNSGGRGRIPF